MQEPKRGMLVRILKGYKYFFKTGALARLVYSHPDLGWIATFDDCGNEPDAYERNRDNSAWFIGEFGVHFEPANLEK